MSGLNGGLRTWHVVAMGVLGVVLQLAMVVGTIAAIAYAVKWVIS